MCVKSASVLFAVPYKKMGRWIRTTKNVPEIIPPTAREPAEHEHTEHTGQKRDKDDK
jgi:hypothetical protein